MKRVLLWIIASPLLVVFVLFDVVKIPVVIGIFLPLAVFFRAIDWCKGAADPMPVGEFLADVSTLGLQMCAELLKVDKP